MTPNGNSAEFSPKTYWRVIAGVLAALFIVPALLQGSIAFFRAFFDTLSTMLFAVNAVGFAALAGMGGFVFWNFDRQRRTQQTLQWREILYQRIREDDRPLTLWEFAERVQSSPASVKPLLDETAREFNARLEVTDRGDVRYCFSPASTVLRSPDRTSIEPNANTVPPSLIQAQLARRLAVSPSTIGKRKHKPDFSEWVRTKDPDGISWHYCDDTKQFHPADSETTR
ncbi:MAG: hypothetical protein J7641_02185 [Cyanobacteria bacterium SID2]|nr:hypothetical protein [Cyanobacteria bacterium SID2]MBP0002546.1 hypothetical protein [Cyanobacteria bacterium SBC]